jgi:hypothetical protein
VVSTQQLRLTADQTDALDRWLHGAARDATNPYQACNAASGLARLGRLEAATIRALSERWLSRAGVLPGSLRSFENILDTYGLACLIDVLPASAAGAPASSSVVDRAAIRGILRPALDRPVDDVQLLYSVAEAWRLAGGPPADLNRLSASVVGRVDPATGLVRTAAARVGTLESSYYVAYIRRLRGLPTDDDRLVEAVRSSMREFGNQFGPNSLLMAAVVLRISGKPDDQLERQAVAAVKVQFSGSLTKANVASWALASRLLDDLGVHVPIGEVRPWAVATQSDRVDAWTAVSLMQGTDPVIPTEFTETIHDIHRVLSEESGKLTIFELRAGVGALTVLGLTDQIPTKALSATLDERRGCPGLPDLYRPVAEAGCDLKSSADAMWLRTFLERQGGTR